MKANWKIALMCFGTLAMVACNPNENGGNEGQEPSGYVNPINVKDNKIDDWNALKPAKVAVAEMPDAPYLSAMKLLKVYSDGIYLNFMMVVDKNEYASHIGHADGVHIYLDLDHSDATGGFYDLFADAAVDLMLEGPIFDDSGNPINYAPDICLWGGRTGGKAEERTVDIDGKKWDQVWQKKNPIEAKSQFFEKDGDYIIEGQILIDYISNKFAEDGFGIGFDIQQGWQGIGLLPQLNATGDKGQFIGRTNMLYVPFDIPENL